LSYAGRNSLVIIINDFEKKATLYIFHSFWTEKMLEDFWIILCKSCSNFVEFEFWVFQFFVIQIYSKNTVFRIWKTPLINENWQKSHNMLWLFLSINTNQII